MVRQSFRTARIVATFGLLACVAFVAWVTTSVAFADETRTKPTGKKLASTVVATVNSAAITEEDLQAVAAFSRIPEEHRERLRRGLIDQLVEQRVMQQFLSEQKISASKPEIEEQLQRVKQAAAQVTGESTDEMQQAGWSDPSIREQIALPLAWQKYCVREIQPEKLTRFFEKHAREFDGSKVHCAQVVFRVQAPPDDPAWSAAMSRMSALRKRIVADEITFADAAKEFSQAPSGKKGGDIGEIRYHGSMPEGFTEVLFNLKEGEISEPFRTRVGIHMCLMKGLIPGELVLEDVRDEVYAAACKALWRRVADDRRAAARIEYVSETDRPESDTNAGRPTTAAKRGTGDKTASGRKTAAEPGSRKNEPNRE